MAIGSPAARLDGRGTTSVLLATSVIGGSGYSHSVIINLVGLIGDGTVSGPRVGAVASDSEPT